MTAARRTPSGKSEPTLVELVVAALSDTTSTESASIAPTATGVTLLEACDNPRLLGSAITLWPRQRALMGDIDHQWGHVWALGRRSGKSTMAAAALVWNALLRPVSQRAYDRARTTTAS